MNNKILIIDNDDQVTQSFIELLKNESYEIHISTNPLEALEIINTKKIDLVICDQDMTELTGIELLEKVKKINYNIIRILMSGYSDINVIISGINKKIIYYYLEKPWQDANVLNIIEEGLQHKNKVEANEKIIREYKRDLEEDRDDAGLEGVNNRKFFRNELFIPLCASMTIVEIKGKRVNTSHSKICVINIGPGGIRFLSSLNFDKNIDMLLKYSMEILGVSVEFEGNVVWKENYKGEKDIYQYGVEFRIDELYRTELIKVLNEMSVRLRKNIRIDKSTLCPEINVIRCLKSKM